jgi:squalene synthase HpnC
MNKREFENSDLISAYQDALLFTNSHYENFPVVSIFLPKKLRKHVAVVYQFARQADDIADEGNFSIEERIKKLDDYRIKLINSLNGIYNDEFWAAFHHTVKTYNLSEDNFYNLLSAFEQDITKTRYQTFEELTDYCSRSANPVGRIILEFFDIRGKEQIEYSDAICTALQLTNFYQDVSVDILKGRIYIPLCEMKEFQITEELFKGKIINKDFIRLMKFQIDRALALFNKGKNLISFLPPMLRFQIRLTILGGAEILNKLEKINYDLLNFRPILSKIDYVKLFFKAVFV